MATRKNRKLRTCRRKQRGGGFFNAIAGVAEKIKGFFAKPADGSASPAGSPNAGKSAGVVNPPLLSPKTSQPSTPKRNLPSNAVVIQMNQKTPKGPTNIGVQGQSSPPTTAVPVGTPAGLSSSFKGVAVPPPPSPNTRIQASTPPAIPGTAASMLGGKRKKNKRCKTQRKCK